MCRAMGSYKVDGSKDIAKGCCWQSNADNRWTIHREEVGDGR